MLLSSDKVTGLSKHCRDVSYQPLHNAEARVRQEEEDQPGLHIGLKSVQVIPLKTMNLTAPSPVKALGGKITQWNLGDARAKGW